MKDKVENTIEPDSSYKEPPFLINREVKRRVTKESGRHDYIDDKLRGIILNHLNFFI